MEFDISGLDASQRYDLMTSVVVPRPIALVTTLGADGAVNAAPFSCYNVLAYHPPVVFLGVDAKSDGDPKDTARNIAETKEFVVNVVGEDIVERMGICGIGFPPGTNELECAGLTATPALRVAVPRIAESPVNLECRHLMTLALGSDDRSIILGEVVHAGVRDDLVDPETGFVESERINPVGRLNRTWYVRTRDRFEIPAYTLAEWQALQEKKGP